MLRTKAPGSVIATALLAALATNAMAQSNVDASNKFGWGENIGWTNWHDAGDPDGAQGAALVPLSAPRIMKGFVWCENVGWINLGDGDPANGFQYANANGTDFGVNVAGNGNLSGFGWGENIGWVNFSGGALATPPQPARYVYAESRFRGYIWGENIGWINLNDNTHYVGTTCPSDFDGDGFITGIDFDLFVQAFEAGDIAADFDGDGFLTGIDYDLYVQAFEAGC